MELALRMVLVESNVMGCVEFRGKNRSGAA